MRNILVTGAGALLGQGILRCLNYSKKEYNLISVDPDTRATGHALANKGYIVPFVTDDGYGERIEEIVRKEEIDIILVGTDVELPFFAEQKDFLEKKYDTRIVVSPLGVVEIANDKWLTAEFLRENGFPFPYSALTTDKDAIQRLQEKSSFPYIAKPVDGARSKGLKILEKVEQLNEVCNYPNNLVVQEKIGEEEGEFTTGCLVVDGKCRAVISLIRDLRDGNTWRAYRKGQSPYDAIIAKIAEKLGVEGPANFQYRIKDGQPIVFEINCRFSGTTPLRYMFGFNEVEALVEYYLEGAPINSPRLNDGTVLRTFSDIFVNNEMLDKFEMNGTIDNFESTYYPFKKEKN